MYLYLYDSFLAAKKFEGVVTRIENRLIDLGINGRVEKLSLLKNAQELLLDGIKEGAKTIVAVGNDATFRRVFSIIASHPVALGYIPIGQQPIARILGIPPDEKACDVLSKRIIEKVDLGRVNDQYFFLSLEVPKAEGVVLECNGSFRVMPRRYGERIQICNFGHVISGRIDALHNPRDGRFEAVFQSAERKGFRKREKLDSVFSVRRLRIRSDARDVSLVADGDRRISTPATVEVVPNRLKLIVGKNRLF